MTLLSSRDALLSSRDEGYESTLVGGACAANLPDSVRQLEEVIPVNDVTWVLLPGSPSGDRSSGSADNQAFPKGTTMLVTSELRHHDSLVERRFSLREIPGILWTPESATSTSVPLILLGQQGGLEQMYPRLVPRAEAAARDGFATVTVELPGSGVRPRIAEFERARADLREVAMAGGTPDADLIERLILPLVDQAVPEWQATLDALLELPELRGPVGVSGGFISIAVRMARVDRRIAAANLFAGSFVPQAIIEEARKVTIPLHVLLQWDDAGNSRQMALDLFDAFGSVQKTLAANMGGHTGVPPWAGEEVGRFFTRHLNSLPG